MQAYRIKPAWPIYLVAIVVAVVSFSVAYQFSKNDCLEIVTATPGVAALFAALFQIFRDHATFERERILQDENNDFSLSATSHMASVAFDKHVEFTETYLREAEKGLSELFRAGPSKKALELANQLYVVRSDFSAWVTKEIRNELEPFEQALRKIGAQSDLLEHIPVGHTRSKLVQDLYDTYKKLAGVKEAGEKDVAAKEEAARLKESFQEFLGVQKLTSLRKHFVDEAIRRCDLKSSALQVLCLMLIAGTSLSSRADTNGVTQTNTIRSQAITAWFSNVTITTITKTTDATTAVINYRPNAVSQAEFAAIKVKAERGDAVAQLQLSYLYGWLVGGGTNAAEGKKWIRKAAEQGLPEAQLEIGWSYYKKDSPEALRWFRKAADQGYTEAQRVVGQCYRIGEGVRADDHEAAMWYIRAAEGGDIEAQKNLAAFYHNSIGVAKDAAKETFWYRKAAEQGDTESQCRLGWAYAEGQGVEKNVGEAARWYRIAADAGDADAQAALASFYLTATGVPRDYQQALELNRKSADQGNITGRRGVAFCLSNGWGANDYGQAFRIYRDLAYEGDVASQNNLANMYEEGKGVPQDFVEAYKWYNIAAGGESYWELQDMFAKNREALVRQMTSSQIAEAQRLSREFKPRKVPNPRSSASGRDVAVSSPAASGSGFFITGDGYLISNNHVVESATQVRLVTSAGLISAKVVKVDAANDLALLKAEGRFAALPVAASRGVKLGGTVATVGFPNIGLQGFAPKLAKGEIASLSGAGDDARYFQISVPVQPGNSGGALVDERGNVVGVVSAKLNASAALRSSGALPENVNYAVKSSYLLSFLESVPEVANKLKEPSAKEKKFEDVVKEAEQAAVLVLVY